MPTPTPELTPRELLEKVASGIATPASFARVASGGRWKLSPHLAVLNYHLLHVAAGNTKRLMVFMPPRHGKSEFISHYFPAWWLGMRPHSKVLLASYEADFAASWGRLARNTLEEHGHLFGVKVAPENRATNRWSILGTRGGMSTAGVGGPLTGKGGELLLLDDPVKNDQQANSATHREAAWQWWRATYRTRAQKGAAMVHIQTRWHADDLAGRILQHDDGGEWTVLNLPAIAEEREEGPLGWEREPGEALWPEQFDEEALEAIRHDVGSHWFAALYQQRPQPAGGGYFKREHFRYYTEPTPGVYLLHTPTGHNTVTRERMRRFTTVDLAASTRTSADYTVVATWGQTAQMDLVLLDLQRVRMEGPDQPALIKAAYDRWNPSQVMVESVAYQLTLVQNLRRLGLPVVELRADKDKISRALVAAARMEGGGVYFPAVAPFLSELEDELLSFPNAAHDDQVDALSYAAKAVSTSNTGRQLVSW